MVVKKSAVKPPTVFISYAKEDEEAARRLYSDLMQVGVDAWLDEKALLPGQDWKKEIRLAISKSDFLVILLSTRAVNKTGYFQKEIRVALEEADECPEGQIFIIPVRLEECEPVFEKLKSLQWVDMYPSWEQGLRKLLQPIAPITLPGSTPNLGRPRVLAVDDEPMWLESLKEELEDWGCIAFTASSGEAALEIVRSREIDLVLTDLRMEGMSGLELLDWLKNYHPALPVVLVTADADVRNAVTAMKNGALDYFVKNQGLSQSIQDVLAKYALRSREMPELSSKTRQEELVGSSSAILKLLMEVDLVAKNNCPILICGQSGTGRQAVARQIHKLSPRTSMPFTALNLAAVPPDLVESKILGHEKGAFTGAVDMRPGCIELAHQGTLFLNEIDAAPLFVQSKLLQVLERGRVRRLGGNRELGVDIRLVACTCRDVQKALQGGHLHEDFVNFFQLKLPPLQERMEDLSPLVNLFIEQFSEKYETQVNGVTTKAMDRLKAYSWPGNVRELRNAVERAIILSKGAPIQVHNLPPAVRELNSPILYDLDLPLGTTILEAEKALILSTLEATGNNRQRASELLGVDVKTIRNMLKVYGMS